MISIKFSIRLKCLSHEGVYLYYGLYRVSLKVTISKKLIEVLYYKIHKQKLRESNWKIGLFILGLKSDWILHWEIPHTKKPQIWKKNWKNRKFEKMRGFIKKIKHGMFKEVLRVPSKFFLYFLDHFRVLSLSGSFLGYFLGLFWGKF